MRLNFHPSKTPTCLWKGTLPYNMLGKFWWSKLDHLFPLQLLCVYSEAAMFEVFSPHASPSSVCLVVSCVYLAPLSVSCPGRCRYWRIWWRRLVDVEDVRADFLPFGILFIFCNLSAYASCEVVLGALGVKSPLCCYSAALLALLLVWFLQWLC